MFFLCVCFVKGWSSSVVVFKPKQKLCAISRLQPAGMERGKVMGSQAHSPRVLRGQPCRPDVASCNKKQTSENLSICKVESLDIMLNMRSNITTTVIEIIYVNLTVLRCAYLGQG